MKTLLSIMAHGEVQSTFNRHLPQWTKHNADLMIWTPQNSRIHCPGIQQQSVHHAEHNGIEAINRFKYILEFMAGTGHELYGFFEYDSFCLGEIPFFDSDIAGNLFFDSTSDTFKGGMFFHPPIFFTNSGMQRLAGEIAQMPSDCEGRMWDRFLGLAVKRAGLTYTSFLTTGEGFAFNTIHPAHYKDMRHAILKGVRCLHGVKDETCLAEALRAWHDRQQFLHV